MYVTVYIPGVYNGCLLFVSLTITQLSIATGSTHAGSTEQLIALLALAIKVSGSEAVAPAANIYPAGVAGGHTSNVGASVSTIGVIEILLVPIHPSVSVTVTE